MKTEEVLDIIRTAIVNAKDNGVDKVALNDLDKMIQALAEDAAESPEGVSAGEAAMATYKANLDALGNSLRYQHETRLEMLRATVTTSQSALRSSLLINAGAAVALLSFMGGIWGKGSYLNVIPGLSYSLSVFVWGVLAGALAAGATYGSQAGYGEEFGRFSVLIGRVFHGVAILAGVTAYICFGSASWLAYGALMAGAN
ncbi:hypothetical protein GGR73_000928 [Xanthomonas sp. F14]